MSQRIHYYSTNRNLEKAKGIVPFKGHVSFKEALLQGQAPDEGLFMPDRIPALSQRHIMALKGKPYAASAMPVAKAFLADEIPETILENIAEDSYNYPVPLENVTGRKYIMRLD